MKLRSFVWTSSIHNLCWGQNFGPVMRQLSSADFTGLWRSARVSLNGERRLHRINCQAFVFFHYFSGTAMTGERVAYLSKFLSNVLCETVILPPVLDLSWTDTRYKIRLKWFIAFQNHQISDKLLELPLWKKVSRVKMINIELKRRGK